MPFQLSQSPRTQAFQMPQGPEDEKELFTQGFSELAYRAFQKSQPELMAEVLTFRVLDVEPDTGTGIGTFILRHEQDIVFVPCVVSDNAVKPLDVFYSRTSDRFYPFTTQWLQEATKSGVNQLGRGVKPPKTMPTDVDIRNLVVPPTTGRYSYAAAADDPAWAPFVTAARKEKTAEEADSPRFLEMMSRASDNMKIGFARVLQRQPKLAHLFGEFYGADKISQVLSQRSVKTAAEHRKEVAMKPGVFIATNATPVSQLKSHMPPGEVPKAYKQLRMHGFYVKDDRHNTDDLISFAETDLRLTQPTSPGVYNVYMASGDVEQCIIVPKPISIHRKRSDEERFPRGYYRDDRNRAPQPNPSRQFLVLFKDGRYATMDDMVAEPIIDVAHGDVVEFLKKMTKESPANGEYGVLISAADLTIKATEPMSAQSVTSKNDRVIFQAEYHHTVILNRLMKGNSVVYPQDQDTVMFADSFRWFKCGKRLSSSEILSAPSSVFRLVEHKLEKRGAHRVLVKRAGSEFKINGEPQTLAGLKAVEKIANVYNLRVKEASEIVSMVAAGAPVSLWHMKRGAESLDPNAQLGAAQDPNAPLPADPNAPPQAPPGPSGLDLAASEKVQQIQAQIAALQQMLTIITEVQQRAQAIDQGGGAGAAPQGAAAMAAGPGSVNGQPAMAPMPLPPGGGATPPSAQGSPPPQGGPPGPPPGVDASQQAPGGPQQGPDPNQGAAPPSPQGAPVGGGMLPSPNAGPPQPPPPPVMADDEPSPEAMQQQINPAFLQDAGSLQDQGIFDATAIASMAKQKGSKELVQNYLPTVEKAMDNMGRMLLLFYMKEQEIKSQIGHEAYEETEQKVRDVFRGLGEAVLALNQYSEQMASPGQRQVQ